MYIQLLASGDVRAALGSPGAATLQDISKDKWSATVAIIKGVSLVRVRLAGRTILPDFLNSTFSGCVFERVRTDGHFWGASNAWTDCEFLDNRLTNVGSPANRFDQCRFERTEFLGYQPADTVFSRCTFADTTFIALKAHLATIPSAHADLLAVNEHLPWGTKCSLAFIGCRFEGCRFQNSLLRHVLFANCDMADTTAEMCDFTGVRADRQWWPDSAHRNMRLALLDAIIEIATAGCGTESVIVGKLLHARADVLAGKDVDYMAAIYAMDVPESELARVEPALDKLLRRFACD